MRRARSATDWYELGRTLEDTDPARAIAAYRRAIAARGDLADAHCNLGRLLHERGELEAAEHHYRQALSYDEVALYWFNLGVLIEDLVARRAGVATPRTLAPAIEAYGRALSLDATLTDAHYNLARVYEQLGKRANDDLMLRRALRHLASYRRLARGA